MTNEQSMKKHITSISVQHNEPTAITDGFPLNIEISEFKKRRADFVKRMPYNSIALIPAGKEVTRSNDTEHAFCQQKNFLYLTNFNEPDALLLLIKPPKKLTDDERQKPYQSILFSLPKDALQEVWHGRRIGQQQAQENYDFSQCFTLDEMLSLVPQYMAGKSHVVFSFKDDDATKNSHGLSFSAQIFNYLAQVRKTIRQGGKVPTSLLDSDNIIDELRLIKSDAEIEQMKHVNVISGLAHQRAMKETAVGKLEYQIEAEILHEFTRFGARHAAYASIVAGGDNGNILHYTANDMPLNDGDLLLIDAGGELNGYAADITRTFPVNGKFTAEQAALYQLVLDSQNLVIEAIKPGVTFAELNTLCNTFLTKGLLALGILSGDLTTLLKDKAVKRYFIHGLGHWLGLDVHDVGDYHIDEHKQQNRVFSAGMVLTIEPGLYIPLAGDVVDDDGVDQKWRGLAVRIEDNILVTETGYENLTINAPKTIEAIEALMSKAN